MNPDTSRAVMLRRTSLICALLVFFIVGVSAYIRLSALGLGCSPWPQCYGQAQTAASSGTIDLLRLLHRVTAVALLPLLLLLLLRGFSRKVAPWDQRWTAVWALVITLFLAVLGRWTAGARVPAVALGNLLGGFLLLALFVRMALLDRGRGSAGALPGKVRRWRNVAIIATLALVTLGGLVSSGLAGLSCPDLFSCPLSDPVAWEALSPWHLPRVDPGSWPVNPQGSIVHLLHRMTAMITAVLLAILAWRLYGCGRRRAGILLLALIAMQLALGLLLVGSGLPLLLVLAHNLCAASLLALLLTLR